MKKFRIVAILLVMCLASSCFVGSTFAKYSSSASGEDRASIAKWSIEVSDRDIANTLTLDNIDLFGTVFDTIAETGVMAAETHVKNDSKIIAPGTQGKFTITVENNSDVTASFAPSISADMSNFINLTISDEDDGAVAPGASVTYTVTWAWPFGDGSTIASDTAKGVASELARTVTAEFSITANPGRLIPLHLKHNLMFKKFEARHTAGGLRFLTCFPWDMSPNACRRYIGCETTRK